MAVFCIVLAGVIINVALNYVFDTPPSVSYLIYPPFAFYRAIALMNDRAFDLSAPDYRMSMMVPGDEVYSCMVALIIDTIVIFILAAYLTAVLPSEFGIQRQWHFVVTGPYKYYRDRKLKALNLREIKNEGIVMPPENNDDDPDMEEDEDVRAEAERVFAEDYPRDSAVVIKNIKKKYATGKLAVKGVSLAIDVRPALISFFFFL